MKPETFQMKDRTIKYSHRRWVIESARIDTHSPIGEVHWEQLKSRAPAVVIVPVNNNGEIGLISQNRTTEDGNCHIVHEFPSGWMESPSLTVSPEQVETEANRELSEEIGYGAHKLQLLTQFRLSNFALVPFYVMMATELEENKLIGDKDEFIELEWVSLEVAEQKLTENQIPTAQVLIALHAYKNYLAKQK